MLRKPELLLPAGNFEKLKYALAYGADAVYAGVPKFSLRARENQFRNEGDIIEAIEYTHSLGKKIYLTTNILPHNRKIDSFLRSMSKLVPHNPDAFIVSDPGLIMLVRENWPDINIHLSVQANCVNWASARFWYRQGVTRLILSRELNINEISEIHEKVPEIELEAFVHGSICIAYSGRCLLSNYFNHRDANQGTCTNSCRWSYHLYEREDKEETDSDDAPVKEGYTPIKGEYYLEQTDREGELMPVDEDEYGTYIMNAKDLMALEYLEELKAAGVSSFKVEGRSKTIYYVSRIARIYRRAVDALAAGKKIDQSLLDEVLAVANRGYTTGFLNGDPKEYGLNYEESRPRYNSEKYAAQVTSYDRSSGQMVIDVKNKISLGDSLIVLNPDGQDNEITVKEIISPKGESVKAVSGGVNGVKINCEYPPEEFSLVTIPLRKNNMREEL
jgi:putative protease